MDDLDRRLLAALRGDGRASVTKLAEGLKTSRATVESRIRRLIARGVILGFTVRLPEGTQDDAVRAIMSIEVVGKSTSAVIQRLKGIPEILTLHTTNGAWDLIAEIRAKDLQAFDKVLRDVRSVEGVLNSETSLLLTTV